MFSQRVLSSSARAVARSATTPSVARLPLARTYAAAASAQNTKPPLELFGIDGTYASALYTAAAKTSTLDTTATSLINLGKYLKSDTKIQGILSSPTLTVKDKQDIAKELLKIASTPSGKDGETVRNFLNTLAENNRLGVLEGVCTKFEELIGAHRGEVEMTVISAQQLDPKVLKQLETAVGKSRFVGQGRKLKVIPKVSPEIRGGLIVEIGDRTIDLSVASKMSRMNQILKEQL